MERRVRPVEGEARAPQTRVPEQQWDTAQVDPRCTEMRRETVTQQMGIHGLGQLGHAAGLVAEMGDAHAGDGLGAPVSWKEPGLQLIQFPVAAQPREQIGGEHHETSALPFALA